MKTGKYFYDLEEGKIDQVAVEDGFLDFFKNYRNLLSTEKGDSQK